MMSLDPSDLGLARIIMQSAGEWYTGEDGSTVTIKDNESFKAGLTVLATLLNEGLVEQVSDWDGGSMPFNRGMSLLRQLVRGFQHDSAGRPKRQMGDNPIYRWRQQFSQCFQHRRSRLVRDQRGWRRRKCQRLFSQYFASNKELMGTLATEIGLVSTMNAAEETEEYTSGLDFYGGQKVFQDFSQWSQEIPAVNYGNHTMPLNLSWLKACNEWSTAKTSIKVLEEAQSQVEAQIAN